MVLSAYVNDTNGDNVLGANVSAYNNVGSLQFSLLTNSSGWTNITTITDYVNNGGIRTYFSNYAINATKTIYSATHDYNVSFRLNNLRDIFTLADSTPPYFIGIVNISMYDNESLYSDIDADDNVALAGYSINWTNTFSINSFSGVLTNSSALGLGIYWINVSIADSSGNTNSQVIFVNVSRSDLNYPGFNIANTFACEGSSLSYVFNVSDSDGDVSTASISPGDLFNIEYSGNVNANLNSYRLFSGTLNKDNAGGVNSGSKIYSENITMVDDYLNSNSSLINITVIEINNRPVMENISSQTVVVGDTFYRQLNVNDSESGNATGGNISFNISFTNTSLFNISSSGVMNFTTNSSYLGTYNITVCATDGGLRNIHANISLCGQDGLNLSVCRNFLFIVGLTPVQNVTGDRPSGGGGGGGVGVGDLNGSGDDENIENGDEPFYNENISDNPNYKCGNWSDCKAVYNLSDILDNKVFFKGQKKRDCTNIQTHIIVEEKRLCDNRVKVILRKNDDCYENTLQVFDENEDLVSRLNFDKGVNSLNIQFLFDKNAYCPYCYDRIKDYDETGVDCGGSCGSCDKQTVRIYSQFWKVVVFVGILVVLLLANVITLSIVRYYGLKTTLSKIQN